MRLEEIKLRYLRKVALLALDCALVMASLPIALFMRLDPADAARLVSEIGFDYYALLLVLCVATSYTTKSYLAILRLANLFTALRVTVALAACFFLFVFFGLLVFNFEPALPRSTVLIQALLTIPAAVCVRFSFRIADRFLAVRGSEGLRTLVYGAGLATDRILPMMLRSPDKYDIVGLLDDNPGKKGAEIQGVRILGGRKQLGSLVKRYDVEQVILSMPSVPGAVLRDIVREITESGVRAKILPHPDTLFDTNETPLTARDLNIEDILRRPPRNLDRDAIRATLEGKVVLVTGGGGSIGSELCRQVALTAPSELVVNDASEFALYSIHQELTERFPSLHVTTSLGDVSNKAFCARLFASRKPDLVFHACAYKHVPLCEENVASAFRNNVGTALRVFEESVRHGVERVVLISSDKAVRPTNVMGATKRICELLTLWYAQHRSQDVTRFCCVRFGNVLGSSGSVIPRFLEQIRSGGPVTVTHPEMTRYFLLIPEAASLVLQAVASAGETSDIFVLNMGEPVRIVDLASDLITLMGKRVDKDVAITFTGLRPGEKMYEELSLDGETMDAVNEDYSRISNLVAVPPSFCAEQEALLDGCFVLSEEDMVKIIFEAILPFESTTGVPLRDAPIRVSAVPSSSKEAST